MQCEISKVRPWHEAEVTKSVYVNQRGAGQLAEILHQNLGNPLVIPYLTTSIYPLFLSTDGRFKSQDKVY